MTRLSFLDLVNVRQGEDAASAIARVGPLAAHVEALGYHRYWIAEHHGMEGVAAAATALIIAEAARATTSIRVGSGGIMLPNHSPLVIAEQFGTLDALFPGRIDLGLGRAPGSDGRVARALRRDQMQQAEEFPRHVMELRAFFSGDPDLGIVAVPGLGARVDIWILGSSLFGAQLAAALGLPYAFASHFAPDALDEALYIYRRDFRPSATLREPYTAAAFNIFAADTQAEAELLASSMQQSFVALRTGNPGKLPPPVPNYRETLPETLQAMLERIMQASVIGTEPVVRAALERFIARTQADEIIVCCAMHDPAARQHSLAIAAQAYRALSPLPA